ncbi:MAG: hypothetical protein P1U53_18435, partial [Sulfitobacter sp.]|nr:hypothetical protein [Sulfitobacter sp.]
MKNVVGATVVFVVAAVSAAQAVEITGGSVELSYSAFTGETDLNKTNIEGAFELAWSQNFSTQFDVGRDSFGASDLDVLSLGLHGVYHLDEGTSFGAFYTHEGADTFGFNDEVDIFGLEFGHDAGKFEIEGYAGRGEAAGIDGTMMGLSGRYAITERVGFSGALDRIDVEGLELESVTLKLDGHVSENLNMYVEVGSGKAELFGVSETEPFVGVGGKVTFGAKRGATFERRSIAAGTLAVIHGVN